MEVNFAFLCDYADQSGKLTAFGIGIDTIYARRIPTTHPLIFAVIQLRFTSVEVGEKQFGVRLIDADSNAIIAPLDTILHVEPPPQGYTYRNQSIALALQGVRLPHYGDYSVRFLVQGQEVKQVPVRLALPPTPPSTG